MVCEFKSQSPVEYEFIKRSHRYFSDEGIEISFPIWTMMMKIDPDQA